jgi:myo-inositol-1(or 4)-monophosphatase
MIGCVEDSLRTDMLNLATQLAAQAGGRTSPHRGRVATQRKPDDSVVTAMDHAIQRDLTAAIRERFPDHVVLGEEGDHAAGRVERTQARFVWVLDPLDGTRNFAAGLPCFATAIAVLDRGEPIVGVVYEHNLRRSYAAATGRGARCDGVPIRATDSSAHHDHLVGIPSSKDDLAVAIVRAWAPVQGIVFRSLGSAAMHLASVAAGAMSAAVGIRAKIWDVAAGVVLIREAGGQISTPAGDPLTPFDLSLNPNQDLPFLAATASTHDYFLRSIP